MSLDARIDRVVDQKIGTAMRGLMNQLNQMSSRDTTNGTVVSTGRENTQLDQAQVTVKHANGETVTAYASARTLRSGDPIVVIGNRVM